MSVRVNPSLKVLGRVPHLLRALGTEFCAAQVDFCLCPCGCGRLGWRCLECVATRQGRADIRRGGSSPYNTSRFCHSPAQGRILSEVLCLQARLLEIQRQCHAGSNGVLQQHPPSLICIELAFGACTLKSQSHRHPATPASRASEKRIILFCLLSRGGGCSRYGRWSTALPSGGCRAHGRSGPS